MPTFKDGNVNELWYPATQLISTMYNCHMLLGQVYSSCFLKNGLRYALTSLSVFLILSRFSAGATVAQILAASPPFLAGRVGLCASP